MDLLTDGSILLTGQVCCSKAQKKLRNHKRQEENRPQIAACVLRHALHLRYRY